MREVEVKAHLQNREAVMQKLLALGCVIDAPVSQEDIVYVKNQGSMEIFLANDCFLRIRETKGKNDFHAEVPSRPNA
jgi:adenylate cyclase class IV